MNKYLFIMGLNLMNITSSRIMHHPQIIIQTVDLSNQKCLLAYKNPKTGKNSLPQLAPYSKLTPNPVEDIKSFLDNNLPHLKNYYGDTKTTEIAESHSAKFVNNRYLLTIDLPYHSTWNMAFDHLNHPPGASDIVKYHWMNKKEYNSGLPKNDLKLIKPSKSSIKSENQKTNQAIVKHTKSYEKFLSTEYPGQKFNITGASSLPIAKDPKTGKRMVLMAKETFFNNKINKNNTAWRSMGGYLQGTATKTALAELFEETAGALEPNLTNFTQLKAAETDFINKNKSKLIPLTVAKNVHPSFLCPIKYLSSDILNNRMQANKKFIPSTESSYLETQELSWIKLDDIINSLKTHKVLKHKGLPMDYRFVGGIRDFKNERRKNKILNILEDISKS